MPSQNPMITPKTRLPESKESPLTLTSNHPPRNWKDVNWTISNSSINTPTPIGPIESDSHWERRRIKDIKELSYEENKTLKWVKRVSLAAIKCEFGRSESRRKRPYVQSDMKDDGIYEREEHRDRDGQKEENKVDDPSLSGLILEWSGSSDNGKNSPQFFIGSESSDSEKRNFREFSAPLESKYPGTSSNDEDLPAGTPDESGMSLYTSSEEDNEPLESDLDKWEIRESNSEPPWFQYPPSDEKELPTGIPEDSKVSYATPEESDEEVQESDPEKWKFADDKVPLEDELPETDGEELPEGMTTEQSVTSSSDDEYVGKLANNIPRGPTLMEVGSQKAISKLSRPSFEGAELKRFRLSLEREKDSRRWKHCDPVQPSGFVTDIQTTTNTTLEGGAPKLKESHAPVILEGLAADIPILPNPCEKPFTTWYSSSSVTSSPSPAPSRKYCSPPKFQKPQEKPNHIPLKHSSTNPTHPRLTISRDSSVSPPPKTRSRRYGHPPLPVYLATGYNLYYTPEPYTTHIPQIIPSPWACPSLTPPYHFAPIQRISSSPLRPSLHPRHALASPSAPSLLPSSLPPPLWQTPFYLFSLLLYPFLQPHLSASPFKYLAFRWRIHLCHLIWLSFLYLLLADIYQSVFPSYPFRFTHCTPGLREPLPPPLRIFGRRKFWAEGDMRVREHGMGVQAGREVGDERGFEEGGLWYGDQGYADVVYVGDLYEERKRVGL